MRKITVVKSFSLAIVLLGLSACGGGSGSGGSDSATTTTTTTTTAATSIRGGGVKGPLANAIVTVYAIDSSQPGFKGAAVASGTTNASAAITGLSLPFPVTPPYILEFTSDAGTTDITTGAAPVITTMRTVITQSLLDSGEQIYATPLTTMAVDIAIANSTTAAELETGLTTAAAQVVSTLGFGMDSSIDIFDTPPLVDSTTTTTAQQAAVAAYRTAVEAVTAIAFQISEQTAGANSDNVLADLSANLADNGAIDPVPNSSINTNTLQVFEQDPASLPIPGTGQTVGDVQAILVAETATTGTATTTTDLDAGGSIATTPAPAETDPDSDSDGTLNVDDAFPNDPNEQVDSDGDGIGDNADPDDNNNGILDVDEGQTPTPVVNDADLDGVEDSADNCPAIFNPSQNDLDGNEVPGTGGGDACDDDIDGDTALNGNDAFPLIAGESVDTDGDGIGNNTDADDDNDGVADPEGGLVAPAGAPSAGVLCSLLRDCDGDGVFDNADFDPTDPTVTSNFAPVANDDTATLDEDATTISIAVTANDTDNDGNPNDSVSLDSIGSNDTALGTAVANGNNIDYTPVADASGTDTFTYTVTDGSVTSTASVTVTVNAVNDAPVITQTGPLGGTMDEDGFPISFAAPAIDATDAEDDTLTWTLGSAATNGIATVSGTGANPTVTYAPTPDFSGSDSFVVSVSDGNQSATITVDVTVTAINDTPVIAESGPLPVSMDEDGSPTAFVAPSISATDAEGSSLTWSLGAAATSGTATVSGTGANPTVTYAPNPNFSGSDSFDVSVSDGNQSATITVDVTVAEINDAPVIAENGPLPVSMDEDGSPTAFVAPSISATDAEGDSLNWTLGAAATSGTATVSGTGANPIVTYAPNPNFSGSDSFDVSVSDGNQSAAITVDVTVAAINDAPVANDDSASVLPDGTVLIAVLDNDSDAEGSPLVPTFGAASAGSVSKIGDSASFDATGLTAGTEATFTYTVNDGDTDSAPATVTVTVTTNQAPVIGQSGPLPVSMDEDGSPTGFVAPTISATDAEGDSLTWDLALAASDGTATVTGTGANPAITYAPDQNFVGSDSFDVRVSDATGSATITVNVTVDAVNDVPVANDDSGTVAEGGIVTIDLTGNDSDAEGSALTLNLGTATNGTLADKGDGTVDYQHDGSETTSASFTYTVNDGDADSNTATVSITVNPVNDDPVAVDDSESVSVNQALITGDVLINDSDIDGGALTITAFDATSVNGGAVSVFGPGTFNYTPDTDYVGSDSFDYTVEDGNGGSDIGTVNIIVNPDGSSIAVATLLDPVQGGGILEELDSWSDGLAQFELFGIYYDSTAGTIELDDRAYDYGTEGFVDISEFDSLFLSGGFWVELDKISVDIADTGDGSADISFRDVTDAILGTANVSAFVSDIAGERLDSYLDGEWLNHMIVPNALFGAGAQFVTNFRLEALDDRYELYIDTWCEDEDPARWAASNANCNGVYDNDSGTFAAALADVQTGTPFVDDNDGTKPAVAIDLAFDEASDTSLLVELQSATNSAVYYKLDHQAGLADYITLLLTDTYLPPANVDGVQMLQLTIPSQLTADFPDLEEDGFLERGYVVQNGLVVREVEIYRTGNVESNPGLNGIARDQILANFDAPAAPDGTELVGTWVPTAAQNDENDFLSLTFFADGTYTHGEVDFGDVDSGMEWGTYSRGADGLLTVTQTIDKNGDTGLTDFVAGPGMIYAEVSGNLLTLSVDDDGNDVIDGTIEFERVISSGTSGTWRPTAAQNDENDFLSLTFFANGTYTHMEVDIDDFNETSGMEWGTYSVDPVTGELTATQLFEGNGSTGLTDFAVDVVAPFAFADTVGDILTISIDETGDSNIDGTLILERSDLSGGTSSGGRLPCDYESGWNDLADDGLGAPIYPNSFADFEGVLASCGTAQIFEIADIAGEAFDDGGETSTFNTLTGSEAGTAANPGSGFYADSGEPNLDFIWYVEQATCVGCNYSYLVQYSDDQVDPVNMPVGLSFRETSALTDITGTKGVAPAAYSFHRYSEQSNYSSDGLVRETGADGEIWNSVSTLQP